MAARRSTSRSAAKKPSAKAAAKPAGRKAPAKKPAPKKAAAKKPTAKKPTAKKPTAKKPTAKKPAPKKAPAKTAAPKQAATKKAPGKSAAKKAPAKAPPTPRAEQPSPREKPAPSGSARSAGSSPEARAPEAAVVPVAPPPVPKTRIEAALAHAGIGPSRVVTAEDVIEAFLSAPVNEDEGWQPLPWSELAGRAFTPRLVELLAERLRGYRWLRQMLALPPDQRAHALAQLGDRLGPKYVEAVEFLARAPEDLLDALEPQFVAELVALAQLTPDRARAADALRHLAHMWRVRGINLADDAASLLEPAGRGEAH